MANTIKHKRGTTTPTAGQLVVGEIAINTSTGAVFTKTDGGSVVALNSNNPTFTGNVTAGQNLISANSSGDEGGEILLAKPQTNTTLSGTGVTIDVYQNRLRIFEQGGSARGAYIDLTAAGAGVATNLLSGGSGGVPTGGTTGQALVKSSDSDYALSWATLPDLTGYASELYVTSQGYLTDAPNDGSEYVRKNGAWSVATGGGGGGISDAPSDGKTYARKDGTWVTGRINAYDNYFTYSVGDQVVHSNVVYLMTTYAGAAGYDPIGYPGYWTAISGPAGTNGTNGIDGTNGTNGVDGAGLVHQGVWADTSTYAINDWVSFGGLPYVSIAASNINNQPDASSSYWLPLTINGTNGTNGTNGADGVDGAMNYLDIMTITANSYGAYVSSGYWNVTYYFLHYGGMGAGWMESKCPTVYFNLYINGVFDSTISGSYDYYTTGGTPAATSINTGDHIEVKLSDGTVEATINYADFII